MANTDPCQKLPEDAFDAVEFQFQELPVSEIEATGSGRPSTLFAAPASIAEWDALEREFDDIAGRVKDGVAADTQGTLQQLERLLRSVAYKPSYVGGELDRKNLRMYEWQRGELYIHSAALILDHETTLEVAYEPEGRLKRLLVESEERSITYLGELPDGVSQEQGNAVAVWRAGKGKSAVPATAAEFLDDLSDIYLDPFREALATRRRFIDEYSVEPHRIRLAYDDQPYEVNYSQTKFRRSHIHALTVIRQSPLDARQAIVDAMRGTGERGASREARARAVVERVMRDGHPEAGAESTAKYALLWIRDNRDQGAFMDTKPEILKQTIETLRSTDPERRILLIGDDLFRGRPELLSSFQEEGVLDGVDTTTLIRFWAADKNNGTALTHGEQALFLNYLNSNADAVQVGMESGALDSGIFLGVPTVYFLATEHVGDKGTRGELYWARWSFGAGRVAQGPDGAKKFFASGRPVKQFERSGGIHQPPLMTVRRVEFGPDLPDPEDRLAAPIAVYYPAKITVGVDQISNLVKSGELIGMADAFDPDWSANSWRASAYYAEQIDRWAHVDTTDWEFAARRYEGITHAITGIVHPEDEILRRAYESTGYHLAAQQGREPDGTASRSEISAAYRAHPQDRGAAVTAALDKMLGGADFRARCVHDLRLVALSGEEKQKLASGLRHVVAANNVLRALGNRAPDGSATTSRHIAEALALPSRQQRSPARLPEAEAAPSSAPRRDAATPSRSHTNRHDTRQASPMPPQARAHAGHPPIGPARRAAPRATPAQVRNAPPHEVAARLAAVAGTGVPAITRVPKRLAAAARSRGPEFAGVTNGGGTVAHGMSAVAVKSLKFDRSR